MADWRGEKVSTLVDSEGVATSRTFELLPDTSAGGTSSATSVLPLRTAAIAVVGSLSAW